MLFIRRSKNLRKRKSAWLYAVVFEGALSTCFIFILFVSFLLQPFHKAIANEFTPEEIPEPTPIAEEVTPQDASPPPEEIPEVATEPDSTSEVFAGSETSEVVEDETENPPEDVVESASEEPSSDSAESDNASEEETASSTDIEEESQSDESVASSTVIQVQNLITEENFYQFSKQSCIEVGNGAYHCTNKEAESVDSQSIVYAEQGDGGNMEIFLKTTRGKVKQITSNNYDDTSPHYDPESMRIVWQRLVDGRYQIIMYDIMDDNESQLTFSRTNSMEPKVSDSGIVWQAWDNNDWEIMLFDGKYTEQLTNNETQDVAPVIQDGYVLWNVLGGTEQQARVYSIDTKEITTIEGYEGGSIINPRFVLVYDTEYANGDIVTQTFDPTTGLSEPIAAKPLPAPIDIPENDPTGEIRALLIQGKSQKEDAEVADIPGDGNNDPVASTTPGTLDLKTPIDDPGIAPVSVTNEPAFELTEYDLVIPPGAMEEALSDSE